MVPEVDFVPRIPLACVTTGMAEQEAVLSVLRSGHLASGAKVQEFERAFAAAQGCKHAVAVSNGTVALIASLRAHGIGPGDEVITSPLTFVATLNAIVEAGATARFADLAEDLTLAPASVAGLITPRTRALLPVHLYGLPADMFALAALARQHGLVIIEDAAQAHGAMVGDAPVGTFGTAAFSFYATKNITCGEGGMVTTDDDAVADRLRLLRNQGMRERYQYELAGSNYRLTDLQAAIAAVQVQRLAELNGRRAANAACLSAGLAGLPGVLLPAVPSGRVHVWHQYTVQVTAHSGIGREQLAKSLDAAGIDARPYYPRLVHDYPCYDRLPQVVRDETPRASRAAAEVLSLPVHPSLSEDDIDRIVSCVRETVTTLGGG
jgi:perosamine synthetase